MRRLFGIVLALLFALPASAQYIIATHGPVNYVGTPGVVPSQASAQGFNTLTFQTTTFSATNVDVTDGCRAAMDAATSTVIPCAKQFYPYRASGANPLTGNGTGGSCLPNLQFVSGAMSLRGCTTGPNGQIATAVPNAGQSDWHGTAFFQGYFEATMTWPSGNYNNTCTAGSTTATCGWIAFWAQPLQFSFLFNGTPGSARWFGQGANYANTLEDDFFEWSGTDATHYMGSALHGAYGTYNVTCPPNYCRTNSAMTRMTTTGFNPATQHKYGWLWVAATASTAGSVSYYIDDVVQPGSQQWDQFQNTGVAPYIPGNMSASPYSCPVGTKCTPTWTFGMHDLYRYVPIFGTGIGGAQISGGGTGPNPWPMNIYSFKVWQVDASQNLTN